MGAELDGRTQPLSTAMFRLFSYGVLSSAYPLLPILKGQLSLDKRVSPIGQRQVPSVANSRQVAATREDYGGLDPHDVARFGHDLRCFGGDARGRGVASDASYEPSGRTVHRPDMRAAIHGRHQGNCN